MELGSMFRASLPAILLVLTLLIFPAVSQDPPSAQPAATAAEAAEPAAAATTAKVLPAHLRRLGPTSPDEHPLMPVLRWAYDGVGNIEKLEDYSATMIKRERVDGKVLDPEYMFVKIRHKPFSVYIHFLAPEEKKGREVIYVEGKNNNNLLAHTTGIQDTLVGTLELDPTGMLAMQDNRYPTTKIGLLNMVNELVKVGEADVKYGECEVEFFENAKINDRVCTCIQVVHPVPRRNFLFHVARIYVDNEVNVPIRYESYDWPEEPGGAPRLLEEYTFLNLKFNNGFTDLDFDVSNPNYKFR